MTQDKQERLKVLKKKIKNCRSWYNFCGTLGLLAIITILLSVLFDNRILTLCAISWVAGSFFAFLSSVVKSKGEELENEACAIELSSQLEAGLGNARQNSVETCFGPIGMN